MKRHTFYLLIIAQFAGMSGLHDAMAQGVANPLGVYGLDRFVSPDVRTRGMGWAGVGAGTNAGALFTNPSLLTTVEGIEVKVGGSYRGSTYDQRQEWYPTKPYATLSLLFEGRLKGIVDTNFQSTTPLERPYDDIGPNWDKSTSSTRPSAIVAALPIDVAGIRFVAAAGYGEAINLDHFFQNNNALSPNIGAYQPAPIPRPEPNETVHVAWYQHTVERKGSVYGLTPGIGVALSDRFSVGFSATVLTGSTDDSQRRVERGLLHLTTSASGGSFNLYTIDSIDYRVTSTGTSTYKGVLPTIGIAFRNENVAVGLTTRLKSTVTRSWDMTTIVDTAGSSSTSGSTGEDKIDIPSNLTIGLAFFPHERWKIGIDYVINNFSDAVYTPAADSARKPWISGRMFRVGAELKVIDGVFVRGGYREDVLAYAAEGAPIAGDPIRGSSYSLGVGVALPVGTLDVAYEYNHIGYRDSWTSNINYNTRNGSILSAEFSVSL